jgi:hypothetical protein
MRSGIFYTVRAEDIRKPQYRSIIQSIRRVGGWCEMTASLGVSCEIVAGQ